MRQKFFQSLLLFIDESEVMVTSDLSPCKIALTQYILKDKHYTQQEISISQKSLSQISRELTLSGMVNVTVNKK